MSEARRFFDRIAGRYDRSYAPSGADSRARNDALLGILGPPRRVLDLGVGTGRELSALREEGHEVVGLEIAPEMIALCNRRAHPIEVVEGDLWEPWPFEGSTFDAVIALHGTLAHPPREDALDALFANARRVLRRGGIVVAELPTAAWLERAHGSGRLERDPGAIGSARFVDEANGAAIAIRLFDEERWQRAARGFTMAFQAIGADELRFIARRTEGS